MKKLIVAIIIIAILVGGYLYLKPQNKIGGWLVNGSTIIGSSSNLKSLPSEAVFSNTTTTPATGEGEMLDGGSVVNQDVVTQNVDSVELFIMAKGDTATSTAFIRQMASFDDTNYFDIASSTANFAGATTTISEADALLSIQFDPGLATTSKVIEFDTYGYPFTRFVVWSENLSTDPNDGVQAFIKALTVEKK